jgi:hypothetical protein
MRTKGKYKLWVTGWMLMAATYAVAQPSNKPGTQSQVRAAASVGPTPSGYFVSGQSPLVNFVRERDAMGRIIDTVLFNSAGYVDVKETTHFFDGLGRPLQTVQRQASPDNSPVDVVTPVVYDPFGREVYKYLPYAATTGNSTDGHLKQDPFTDQQNFYQNVYPAQQPAYTGEQVYYGQTVYESSPLNRVLQSLAPGNSWAGSGNGVSQQYLVNSSTDSVVMWTLNSDSLTFQNNDITTNIPYSIGYYSPGQLYKNVTVDEQVHAVVEYKNKEGFVILKKVQIGTVAGDFSGYSGWLSTFYVYDNLNQLRFVMSPKAFRVIYSNGWNVSTDTTTISELCYRYEYDGRKRMIAKKVPGAGWVYMVYDGRDRLVFTQDANMRSRSQWMTTLYDALNRPAVTGMITYNGNRSQLQAYDTANAGSGVTSGVTVSGTGTGSLPQTLDLTDTAENGDHQALNTVEWDPGFSTPDIVDFTAEIVTSGPTGTPFIDSLTIVGNPPPPGSNFVALTMNFYDDYSNISDKHYTTTYNSLLDPGTNQHAETLPGTEDQLTAQTLGLVTGTRVRVLEDPSDLTKGNWLATATFYDDRGRVIQTQGDNYRGGEDTLTTLYNFTGQPITTYLAHANPQAPVNGNTRIKTNLNYDASNRLIQVYKTVNDTSTRLLAQHSYDQLGQMIQKQLGQIPAGAFLETQDYTYNIRGWLKGINKDYADNDNSHGANNRWFGMELSYDWGFANNQLNGNIAGNKWRSKGDGQQRAYGFGYDPANRLLFADFNQYDGSWDKNAKVDFSSTMGDGFNPTTAYDENGNILAMQQLAWQLGGSQLIDSLRYTYNFNSNKLMNVIDGKNNPLTTLGDFRTSSLSPYYNGKTIAAVDYTYDPNGNLTRDLNKDIGSLAAGGIIYNHLNLPWRISVRDSAGGSKGTITYIYDAAGNKLMKTTLDSAGGLQTVATYIGAFQYQGKQTLSTGSGPADTLQFLGHEEGRARITTDTTGGRNTPSFKYDYFLKDHQGNTRMVLTDEQEVDRYPAATMEVGDSSLENLYYTNLDDTRSSLPAGYPTDTTTTPNTFVARLSGGAAGPKVGPGITLKVMAGDQFSIKVSSWYRLSGTTPGTPANPLADVVSALINGIGALPGGGHPSASALQTNSAPLTSNVMQFLGDTGMAIFQTKPHAFVNWILFDNQFNFVAASSGFDQVGADQELHKHILTNLPVTSSGYLYIYTSNETPNVDVFFDNLQVTQTRGPLLEENNYYPFGLTMAGISDKALKSNYAENKYRFQKQELQNKEFSDGSGLEMYEFKYRMDDPQTGRFWSIDPLADKYPHNSTYAFSEDKVTGHIELEGLEAVDIATIARSFWADTQEAMQGFSRLATDKTEQSNGQAPPQIQSVINTANKGNDIVAATKPLVDVLEITNALASSLPITEAGAPEFEIGFVRSLGATGPAEEGAAGAVNLDSRAAEIHGALKSAVTRNSTTTAVASGTTANGRGVTLVGFSEKNLRPEQLAALKPGEIPVAGAGHAETTILAHAEANGITVTGIGASRGICSSCAFAMYDAGVTPGKLKYEAIRPIVDGTYMKPANLPKPVQ